MVCYAEDKQTSQMSGIHGYVHICPRPRGKGFILAVCVLSCVARLEDPYPLPKAISSLYTYVTAMFQCV